jgi:Leucine-rich repeat (LRR) protein
MRHLDLSWCGFRELNDNETFKFVIEKFPHLEYLDMSNKKLSDVCMREICALNKLKTLKLAGCFSITDATIIKIFINCTNIETIDLEYCQLLTGECFSYAPGTLKNLNIDGCHRVSLILIDFKY